MEKQTKIYSVTQINTMIKSVLDNSLPPRLIVRGEISNFKHHRSGHCYFTLKDENSSLACVMWKSSFARVKFDPENGQEILATGFIDVYPPHGKYQLRVEQMEPAGMGALQLAFEQMVKKLEAEGLFNDQYKKALPRYPQKIAILTSESGAAVHDITDSVYNRWPCVELMLYPVPVQGDGAAEKIAAAIRDLNRRNEKLDIDLLIVGRGGGSMEDLWAFNEEVLARAIFDSEIPIISAVGHEVDITIADLVADARASTPTKAGVTAVPDKTEVLSNILHMATRINNVMKHRLEAGKNRLETIMASAAFKSPLSIIQNKTQLLDETEMTLERELKESVRAAEIRLGNYLEKIRKIEPHRLLANKTIQLNELQGKMLSEMRQVLSDSILQMTAQENRLAALNPKSVLKRGYSITTSLKTGKLIKSLDDVAPGDIITTELAGEKKIESEVKSKKSKDRK